MKYDYKLHPRRKEPKRAPLLTREELAKQLGLSPNQISRLAFPATFNMAKGTSPRSYYNLEVCRNHLAKILAEKESKDGLSSL